MEADNYKTCATCAIKKPIENFYKTYQSKAYEKNCKECHKIKIKQWRAKGCRKTESYYKYGSVEEAIKLPGIVKKFWENVRVGNETECWLWLGSRGNRGHGQMSVKGRMIGAHRIAYVLAYGNIPDHMLIRHLVCDNPPCCNPAHLAYGTCQDNVNDMMARGSQAKGHKNAVSKLKESDVLEIRKEYGTLSNKTLALKFGVSAKTIKDAALGKYWKHVV